MVVKNNTFWWVCMSASNSCNSERLIIRSKYIFSKIEYAGNCWHLSSLNKVANILDRCWPVKREVMSPVFIYGNCRTKYIPMSRRTLRIYKKRTQLTPRLRTISASHKLPMWGSNLQYWSRKGQDDLLNLMSLFTITTPI